VRSAPSSSGSAPSTALGGRRALQAIACEAGRGAASSKDDKLHGLIKDWLAGQDPPDPHAQRLDEVEAQFFSSSHEKESIHDARHKYPKKKTNTGVDPLTGEEEEVIPRRIMGFGLGFERIFATTSIKLPVSAYTIFVELQAAHKEEVTFSRCFNGLHTVFDLKKWIFEKLLVPMNAYDLSYAEPGKATLTDQLRLLTTQDSLDTRTLATTRAVHGMFRGIPGVHSISDVGVTRLYVRLKCRTCGDLLNSIQTCRKFKAFGHIEPAPDNHLIIEKANKSSAAERAVKTDPKETTSSRRFTIAPAHSRPSEVENKKKQDCGVMGVPGMDPTIEDCWYSPDEKRHCLFHSRGYELFEAARTHGGHSELARIYLSRGKEPSKKLRVAENVLAARSRTEVSY